MIMLNARGEVADVQDASQFEPIEHEDWTNDNSQTMTQEQIVASLALVTWLVMTY